MRAWRRISLSKPVPDSGARRRAARCAAPIGLLPSFALPGLSPTRPSAQGRRKEPTERPPAAHSASMRAPLLPGGAQKARSHRTRARLASPPPGFLEALTNRSLQQNERKARSRRRAPQVRFASPHRSAYRGCTQRPADPAAPQRGPDAPPHHQRRVPFPPHSPRGAALPVAGRRPRRVGARPPPVRRSPPVRWGRAGSGAAARTPPHAALIATRQLRAANQRAAATWRGSSNYRGEFSELAGLHKGHSLRGKEKRAASASGNAQPEPAGDLKQETPSPHTDTAAFRTSQHLNRRNVWHTLR